MSIELIRGLYNLKPKHKGCVLTIGNFDGVHLGHQALIQKVKQRAKEMHLPSFVMTFEPLPKEYFGNNPLVPRLTRWREKMVLFSQLGIDKVFVAHFDAKLAALTKEDFVKHILCESLGAKHIIVGDDFRFGSARQGDFPYLVEAGKQYHFSTEAMQSITVDHHRVSSTLVREALIKADHEFAEKLLGRPYTMQGRVVHGNKLGRTIGFPTANIYLHRKVSPVQGVYAVRMFGVNTIGLPGVANVGNRPTIGGIGTLLEVHLFNFDEEIYGKHVTVEFCQKFRDEKRYDSLELMAEQIRKDADQAHEYFVKRGLR